MGSIKLCSLEASRSTESNHSVISKSHLLATECKSVIEAAAAELWWDALNININKNSWQSSPIFAYCLLDFLFLSLLLIQFLPDLSDFYYLLLFSLFYYLLSSCQQNISHLFNFTAVGNDNKNWMNLWIWRCHQVALTGSCEFRFWFKCK